ncbi:hypothetical protein CMO91_06325 [Candidatus Woesearchaeota archaeon]|mgnify:CR=1 FL=1|nr:hypothetical protein [Candidatus Woesearchaeota archaeon]|tara:strand:+ start:373 stop:642 length:270 start_codon:yes stop_codon:yes gene_type:complete
MSFNSFEIADKINNVVAEFGFQVSIFPTLPQHNDAYLFGLGPLDEFNNAPKFKERESGALEALKKTFGGTIDSHEVVYEVSNEQAEAYA